MPPPHRAAAGRDSPLCGSGVRPGVFVPVWPAVPPRTDWRSRPGKGKCGCSPRGGRTQVVEVAVAETLSSPGPESGHAGMSRSSSGDRVSVPVEWARTSPRKLFAAREARISKRLGATIDVRNRVFLQCAEAPGQCDRLVETSFVPAARPLCPRRFLAAASSTSLAAVPAAGAAGPRRAAR